MPEYLRCPALPWRQTPELGFCRLTTNKQLLARIPGSSMRFSLIDPGGGADVGFLVWFGFHL